MSQLNFNINARRQLTLQPRAYNPRGKVRLRRMSPLWNFIAIVAVMAGVFVIVWFV